MFTFTRKSKTRKQSNVKRRSSSKGYVRNFEEEVVLKFIEMLNTVKLFHWHTASFPIHKATDELYESLNKYVDEFVEAMLGKAPTRFNLTRVGSIKIHDFSRPEQFKQKLEEYKTYLINITDKLDQTLSSDLLNIRDEILSALNKTTYLMTLH